jgi:hypothetical protein
LICFTGEKFATGQERFAPWYVYHKRTAAHLTGRAPRLMKQVNISDPWYHCHAKADNAASTVYTRAQ